MAVERASIVQDLLWAGADAQARALRERVVRADELLLHVLERQALLDPALNAFRVVYADGAWPAAEAAQKRIDGGEATPLLGVPVAVKDDLDVAGDVTGMGGRPQHGPVTADSEVVARLRAAGAIVVGRTNVPERCLWPFTESLAHGVTRNPWSLDHSPGGSSGGSAAAVAAGIVGVATGSDGGGSIRIPSGFCGLLGVKTTRGLVPLGGERWHGLSVAGPIGRTVADAAAMLDVIADDGSERPEGGTPYRDAAATDPRPLRIALSWRTPIGPARIDRRRRAAITETAERLRGLGHEVVEREVPAGLREFAMFLVHYLRGGGDDAAGVPHPAWLESRTRGVRALGRLVPDRLLRWARDAVPGSRAAVDRIFDDVDVVLQPGPTGPPFRIGAFHRRGALATMLGVAPRIPHMQLWNLLGHPVAAVPVGRDDAGLPMGVQLVGPHHAERLLLSLAGQLERDRPWVQDRPAGLG